ncbi:hypothetical protein H9Q16_08255 [Sulfitobacter sp. TSTF-M16]|uniref:Uncharacterized protein n=1 Tax=Sulfitobacter aestuariivivens TaxID=2766981 RepID=A0A927HG54_9RHOB|nr:hypothetical protein [Sulfitobacter aestuariivivens]
MSAVAAEIDQFFGRYEGSAEEIVAGEARLRDMSTTIEAQDKGFSVSWTSVTYKSDGRSKEKTYTINFTPSQRESIYGSAMQTNMFGKQIPLDPLKGEPFVWARLEGDTLSLYSMFIAEEGAYEIQEYHRTLVEGGLDLTFRRINQGTAVREVNAFLERAS